MFFTQNIKTYRDCSFQFTLPIGRQNDYTIEFSDLVKKKHDSQPRLILVWYDSESKVMFLGRSDWINTKDFYTDIYCYKSIDQINETTFKVKQAGIELYNTLNTKLTKTLFKKVIKDFINQELKTYELFKILQSKLCTQTKRKKNLEK